MQQLEKTQLTNLKQLANSDKFNDTIGKLTTNEELTTEEKSYLLTAALILIRNYNKDKRRTLYLEFAYYIILKYSVTYNDYKPLYDFSTGFGFYPITNSILSYDLITKSIKDIVIDSQINDFYNGSYIPTIEQLNVHRNILFFDNLQELAFVAPTSYGKSAIIVDLIKKYDSNNIKIGIIIPTKSLLLQTFKLLKKNNLQKKLLLHEDMYNKECTFIAIFTQERALRFLNKHKITFDILFIDEAHNLFKKDSRNILLSRLINKNLKKNTETKIIYLSPLILDENNLKVQDKQNINMQRISFNIKEPEIYEYLTDNNILQYSRFTDKFYYLGKSEKSYFDYIKTYSKQKNFLYLKAPKKVERLANALANTISSNIDDESILRLIEVLKENIHEEFYIIQLLRKGILYLHGKLPDIIKEYLEYKFRTISAIKYIVANSVILEGINLPIDNMYILNVHGLSEKDLTNLIGRINRLDEVFSTDTAKLNKLLPNVHFINSDEYNRKNGTMKNTIIKLRSRLFKDKIQNPILVSYNIKELDHKIQKAKNDKQLESAKKDKQKVLNTIENEKCLYKESLNEIDILKQYLIENEIHDFYGNFEMCLKLLYHKILLIKNTDLNNWSSQRIIDKIFNLFIYEQYDNINDFEFKRLNEEPARNYYHIFIEQSHIKTLKDRINITFKYFKSVSTDVNKSNLLYFGESYGEEQKETKQYKGNGFKVYINLSKKEDHELINLAIVKIQMEDNFVSYKLSKFVEFMYEYKLITEDEYNLHYYGTRNPKNIALLKFGLNNYLVNKLSDYNQLNNIKIDQYGNLECNNEFRTFLTTIDDFYKFQIEKFIF